jgi:hypothetical protein
MELGHAVKVGNWPCPYCKWLIDGAAQVGENVKGNTHSPKEGDFGICTHCANWIVYKANGEPRQVEIKDIEEMSQSNFDGLVQAGLVIFRIKQRKRGEA